MRPDQVVARSLVKRAPVEAQRLDDAAQAVLDRRVHLLRVEIDEARRQIAEERLEAAALRHVVGDVIPRMRLRWIGLRGIGRHAALDRCIGTHNRMYPMNQALARAATPRRTELARLRPPLVRSATPEPRPKTNRRTLPR